MIKTDSNLIYLLSENARTSLKDLSRYLRRSPQSLKYSISVLQKEGIIKDPFCIFDYSYFGLVLFRVYYRGCYVSDPEKERIIKELSSNPYIISIYELTGEFDLAVEFACPNPSKFNKELKKISSLIPTLNDYKIILNLVTYICPRRYLTKTESLNSLNTEKIVGGDRERETFTKNEMIIMKNILLDPTIRFTQLAKKSELNVKTAKSVLRGLIKRNIIKEFNYTIDTNKLGINKFRLFLRLHNLRLERESELMKFILDTKEIVQLNKTVGDWDMELDIESKDKNKIRYIILQIRHQFKEIIQGFNLIEFYNYSKKSFLPFYLFKEEET